MFNKEKLKGFICGVCATPPDKFDKEKIYNGSVKSGEYAYYHKKDQTIPCKNMVSSDMTLILDGKYDRFVSKAVYGYQKIGSTYEAKITFYSVTDSGEETEIASYTTKQTEAPIDVNVNVKGVQNLKIKFQDGGMQRIFDAALLGK